MNLTLDWTVSESYTSRSQKARVTTENWVWENLFCPACGDGSMQKYPANSPVADFYCGHCKTDFELKSKRSPYQYTDSRVVDGAYATMIERITSEGNPSLLYMIHNGQIVTNLLVIPKYFFVPAIIEKRKPLNTSARRAGWVGCTIDLHHVPSAGKIFIIQNGKETDRQDIIRRYNLSSALRTHNMDHRGWLLDVLSCVERLNTEYTLDEMYAFEQELSLKHPANRHIRDKIRQQLQRLRDAGYIDFIGQGKYRKVI
jgi:type II restriction enzyme